MSTKPTTLLQYWERAIKIATEHESEQAEPSGDRLQTMASTIFANMGRAASLSTDAMAAQMNMPTYGPGYYQGIIEQIDPGKRNTTINSPRRLASPMDHTLRDPNNTQDHGVTGLMLPAPQARKATAEGPEGPPGAQGDPGPAGQDMPQPALDGANTTPLQNQPVATTDPAAFGQDDVRCRCRNPNHPHNVSNIVAPGMLDSAELQAIVDSVDDAFLESVDLPRDVLVLQFTDTGALISESKTVLESKWWKSLSPKQKRDYLVKHPRSKYARAVVQKYKKAGKPLPPSLKSLNNPGRRGGSAGRRQGGAPNRNTRSGNNRLRRASKNKGIIGTIVGMAKQKLSGTSIAAMGKFLAGKKLSKEEHAKMKVGLFTLAAVMTAALVSVGIGATVGVGPMSNFVTHYIDSIKNQRQELISAYASGDVGIEALAGDIDPVEAFTEHFMRWVADNAPVSDEDGEDSAEKDDNKGDKEKDDE